MEWRTDLRNDEVDGHLVARRVVKGFEVGEEGTLSEILELLNSAAAGKIKSWSCGMMWWRRSTREGTIYRTKRARANLTYLCTVSVKSEVT